MRWIFALSLVLAGCSKPKPNVPADTTVIDTITKPVPDSVVEYPDSGDTAVSKDTAAPETLALSGIPYGVAEWPNDSLCNGTYTATIKGVPPVSSFSSPSARNTAFQRTVDRARSCNVRLVLRIARKALSGSNGCLNVTTATNEIKTWPASWGSDPTIIGFHLGDDPALESWCGTMQQRLAKWDQIACTPKARFPNKARFLRARPEQMKMLGHKYSCMTAAMAQYQQKLGQRYGGASKFFAAEVASAKSQGLKLVVALNLLAGGCGNGREWHCFVPGTTAPGPEGYQMSSYEVKYAGNAGLADPYVCAMLSWSGQESYRGDFYKKAANISALKAVAVIAKSHPFSSCL